MTNIRIEILEQLISEGESLTSTISETIPHPDVIIYSKKYKTSEDDCYQDWLSSVQRFIKTNHTSNTEDFKNAASKLSPDNHRKILSILRAIKRFPTEPYEVSDSKSASTNININNNQNNTQKVTVNLFLEAIKEELTEKNFKEVKEILKDFETEPEKTKITLIQRIKEFGGDVLSNIVANILTNPTIYHGLFQ